MADDERSSSSPARAPASAPRPPATPPQAGFRLVLAARSVDKLQALAGELGGDERALAVRCDVTDFGRAGGARRRRPRALRPPRRRLRQRRLRRRARASWRTTPEHWREMVLTNVLGAAYTDPRHAARPEGVDRAHPAHRLGRRPPRDPGQPLLRPPSGRSPAWASRCARTSTAPASASRVIEPGMVDTPFFDNPGEGRLEADDIARAVMFAIAAAPARRRQRDPHPPDGAVGVASTDGTVRAIRGRRRAADPQEALRRAREAVRASRRERGDERDTSRPTSSPDATLSAARRRTRCARRRALRGRLRRQRRRPTPRRRARRSPRGRDGRW